MEGRSEVADGCSELVRLAAAPSDAEPEKIDDISYDIDRLL